MTPGPFHWAVAASVAIALHLAAFYSNDAQGWRAAEQAAGAPEAVWGLTEIALTEEIDPTKTAVPEKPVEEVEDLEPVDSQALSAVAPVEQAAIAAPEAVEPVEKKDEVKPVEEPKEVKKKEKPKPKKATASGGPVGRASGSSGQRSSRSGGANFSNYAGRVAAHLRRYKRYPSSAGRARGTVRVAFSVSRGGTVTGVRLVSSSGNATLDRAALDMVRRANPFPPMPAGLNRSSASFAVPIRFSR